MEVRELLSQVILDISGHVPGNMTPKRPNPMVILTPPPHKLRYLSELVDTSSQVTAPDDTKMTEGCLEEIPSPTAETPGPCSSAPSSDASYLLEEANKVLGELLATKSSIDAHGQKLVWELGMSLCQNDSKTMESFKEAKAICTHSTQEAEALCSTTIKEAKATCAYSIQEAGTHCSKAVKDTEAQRAAQADSLHQTHDQWVNQHLEEQAIQEEGKSQLDFLFACQDTIQARPVELCGTLVASYHILMGEAPTSHPFTLSQWAPSTEQAPAPVAPSSPAPEHSPQPKW